MIIVNPGNYRRQHPKAYFEEVWQRCELFEALHGYMANHVIAALYAANNSRSMRWARALFVRSGKGRIIGITCPLRSGLRNMCAPFPF